MRPVLSAVCALLFLTYSLSAAADSFENEISFDYSNTRGSNNYTGQDYRLLFTRYFSPVDAGAGPLGEAVFLARPSSIGMSLWHAPDDDYQTQIQYGIEATFRSQNTPITASAGMTRTNAEIQYSAVGGGHGASTYSSDKYNMNMFQGGVGVYIGERSHIGINYTQFEVDASPSSSADAWEFSGKHLAHISENQDLSITCL